MYDNLRNDYIVFDTEYVHSFDTQAEKDKAKKTVEKIADKLNLIKTGGTDCHNKDLL